MSGRIKRQTAVAGFALGVTIAGLASRLPNPTAAAAVISPSAQGQADPGEGQRVTFDLAGATGDEAAAVDLTGVSPVLDLRSDITPTLLPPVSVERPATEAADAFTIDGFVATTITTSSTVVTASTIPAPGSSSIEVAESALAQISYPWEALLPDWRIEFLDGRDGVLGYTWSTEQRIEIFVREGQTIEFLAHVIAHELGHAVDIELNSPDDRREWQASRGISGLAWWAESGMSDFATGAGDWAESFAAWQVGDEYFRSQLGGSPDAVQLSVLAALASS